MVASPSIWGRLLQDAALGVYEREGRDLKRTIGRVIALAKSKPETPFEALHQWLGGGMRVFDAVSDSVSAPDG